MVVENLRLNNPVMEWAQGVGPKRPPTTVEPDYRRFWGDLGTTSRFGGTFNGLGGLVYDECPLNLKLAVAVNTWRNLELLAALLDRPKKCLQESAEKQLRKWLPGGELNGQWVRRIGGS